MTYLQLVNQVLVRLREERVGTLQGSDDNVVILAAAYVNDARRQVANAHTWNAYREFWNVPTVQGLPFVALPGAGKYANIETIYRADGNELKLQPLSYVRKQNVQNSNTADPLYYAPDGLDDSGDLALQLAPTPNSVQTLSIYGYKAPVDLVGDDDVCLLPQLPVYLLATALAAAERGEVGGQPSAELFAIASQALSDAIALDASLNTLDDVWYS